MEDLEKELGPLIENFQNLVRDAKEKKLDSLREDEDFKKEFNQLSKGVIEPVMRKFESYLQSKDVNSSVNIQSQIVAGKNPSIEFSLHFKLTHESKYPNIKFSSSGERISIQEDGLTAKGEVRQDMMPEYYDKEEITEEFIKERLIRLIKSCFDKNWQSFYP
ncbi:MAG: hypothetical protein E6K94_11130 [Thaumarchaeota archaeon]|nr:MAG: hypothetical protein E6K94_11130 [Nitrososphaerota archaeon]